MDNEEQIKWETNVLAKTNRQRIASASEAFSLDQLTMWRGGGPKTTGTREGWEERRPRINSIPRARHKRSIVVLLRCTKCMICQLLCIYHIIVIVLFWACASGAGAERGRTADGPWHSNPAPASNCTSIINIKWNDRNETHACVRFRTTKMRWRRTIERMRERPVVGWLGENGMGRQMVGRSVGWNRTSIAVCARAHQNSYEHVRFPTINDHFQF